MEIKWIHRHNNPDDLVTKNKLFSALKRLIDINWINLNTTKWVKRAERMASTK